MTMLMLMRSAVSSVCCLFSDELDDDEYEYEYEYDDGDANIVLVDVYNNSNSIRCANATQGEREGGGSMSDLKPPDTVAGRR